MTIDYKNLNPVTIELANITLDNRKKGVLSTPLKLMPAFIMPDNTIYYTTTDHYSANFYEELETALDIIGKNRMLSLNELREKITIFKNKLGIDYQRFFNNDITYFDVRKYLNINCLEINNYNYNLKDIFSSECRNVLLMLLNSKIQIYDYFLQLLDQSNDVINHLKSHPNISSLKHEKILENARKTLRTTGNLKEKIILNNILITLGELLKNELIDLMNVNFLQDFAVLTIGVDKIETQLNKTISTSKQNPNEFYFNYLLMGYNVVQLPKVIFDIKKQKFSKTDVNDYSITSHYDEKYKEEANLIKKKVPYCDRYKYFI